MEACYGGAAVMERSCAVARGIDINTIYHNSITNPPCYQELCAVSTLLCCMVYIQLYQHRGL